MNTLAIFLIRAYRVILSPDHGIPHRLGLTRPTCVFYPTCSHYAEQAFQKYPFFKALKLTLHRISRCHPGTEPQVDNLL